MATVDAGVEAGVEEVRNEVLLSISESITHVLAPSNLSLTQLNQIITRISASVQKKWTHECIHALSHNLLGMLWLLGPWADELQIDPIVSTKPSVGFICHWFRNQWGVKLHSWCVDTLVYSFRQVGLEESQIESQIRLLLTKWYTILHPRRVSPCTPQEWESYAELAIPMLHKIGPSTLEECQTWTIYIKSLFFEESHQFQTDLAILYEKTMKSNPNRLMGCSQGMLQILQELHFARLAAQPINSRSSGSNSEKKYRSSLHLRLQTPNRSIKTLHAPS